MRVASGRALLLACATLVPAAAFDVGAGSRPVPRSSPRAVSRAQPPLLAVAPSSSPSEAARGAVVGWGVIGVVGILANAIKRLAPIAALPLATGAQPLTVVQWGAYGAMVTFFAYVEGYKAFHKKFSPLVVARAMSLKQEGHRGLVNALFAPLYSMGLFHATKKRQIVSWTVSLSVAVIVILVKRLPYPWRSIVDAGVCSGLSLGAASIALLYARALAGTPPTADPCLPPAAPKP